jgi:hypothetical protein
LLRIFLEAELNRSPQVNIIQKILALVAVLFGLLTTIVGFRVLTGSDLGYIVFRPLLIYNTAMGTAYVSAGVIAWRNVAQGKHAAATIFVLNLLVLGLISYLHVGVSVVAIESVRAMIFRTVAWFVLFLGMVLVSRRNHVPEFKHDTQPSVHRTDLKRFAGDLEGWPTRKPCGSRDHPV